MNDVGYSEKGTGGMSNRGKQQCHLQRHETRGLNPGMQAGNEMVPVYKHL